MSHILTEYLLKVGSIHRKGVNLLNFPNESGDYTNLLYSQIMKSTRPLPSLKSLH